MRDERLEQRVFLLDAAGTIRLWNRAAEAITGLAEEAVLGRRAEDVLPGWSGIAPKAAVKAWDARTGGGCE